MTQSVVPTDPPSQPAARSKAAASRTRLLVKGACVAGFVMLTAECLRIFVGSNFNTVVPGKCFRSAQPNARFLESAQRSYGVASIINLRDENEDEAWYHEEKNTAERLGVKLFNAGLSSKEQPPEIDFHRFVRTMRDAPEPVLIHCANGNDRSGLASAVYLLMRTDTPIHQARGQLSLRYGHIPWTKASCLGRILDNYEAWLSETGKVHTAEHFYYWGIHIYRQEEPR